MSLEERKSCEFHCNEQDETMNINHRNINNDDDEWGQFVDLASRRGVLRRNRIVSRSDNDDDLFALVMEF